MLVRPDPDDPLVGTRLDDRYLLLRRLGKGGMGVVYEALHLAMERRVAVKLVRTLYGEDKRATQRFCMEARALSRLEHPNVVRLYDFGTGEGGAPYLVMELLRGRSLADELERAGLPLPLSRAAWVIDQAARGLSAAHRVGLVHRDLKPENLWLGEPSDDGDEERIKVIDFGLVRGADLAPSEVAGSLAGTPFYMSPEQCEGRPDITPASDVYALGVLLFELAVGHVPYGGRALVEVLHAHLSAPVPPARKNDAGVPLPDALGDVLQRALSKRPEERFADASELRRALAPLLGDDFVATSDSLQLPSAASPSSSHELAATATSLDSLDAVLRERKLCTVLSLVLADAPGIDPIDPDERLEQVVPLAEACAEIVTEQGGIVLPVDAWGLRAVFGLPAAREDDARRALRAALSARVATEAGPAGIVAELGLHTRFVLATADVRAAGGFRLAEEPWSEARAVAGVAGRRGVALSGATYRSLQRHLSRPIPPVAEVAGETVHAVRDGDALATTPDVRVGPALVGRSRELGALRALATVCLAGRDARFALVVGEPGIGKTRLCRELETLLAAEQPDVHVLMGAPDGRASFGVFRRLLAEAAGSGAGTTNENVRRWLTRALTTPGLTSESAGGILRLVGLSTEPGRSTSMPQLDRQRACGALADLFRSLAARGGVVLAIDDLQDADKDSLDLLAALVAELRGFPFLVLGLARTGFASTHEVALSLGPLDATASRELAIALLGHKAAAPAATLAAILERAEGNPFFIEELVRHARPRAGARARLPESVHAVLRARIDALGPEHRAVLRAAAIVGPTFWPGALAAQGLDDAAARLDELERAGLVRRLPQSHFEGESEWAFAHRMTLDVAYESLLKRARRDGHRAVAAWLDRQGSAVPPALYPLIATQLEHGGQTEAAAVAFRRSGDAARDRGASEEAAHAYGRALSLQRDMASPERLRLDLGVALHQLGRVAESDAHLLAVADSAYAEPDVRLSALRHAARNAARSARGPDQMALLERAVRESPEATLPERLLVAADLAFALVSRGEDGRAAEVIDGALESAYAADEMASVLFPIGNLLLAQAILLRRTGDLDGAERAAQGSIETFEVLDFPSGVATGLVSLSVGHRDRGRWVEAAQTAARAARLFREAGSRASEVLARINFAWARIEQGQVLLGRQALRQLRAEMGAGFSPQDRALADSGEALAAAALGQPEAAEGLVRSALEAAGSAPGELRGFALHAEGVVRRDAKPLQEAIALWRTLNRPAWVVRSAEALAPLVGKAEAEQLTHVARTIRAQIGMAS